MGSYIGGSGTRTLQNDDDFMSATPPPIARSRTMNTYTRPSSAGGGGGGLGGGQRRGSTAISAFGVDGHSRRKSSIDVDKGISGGVETEENQNSKVGGGGRWFGLGRTGSLSRRN